MQRRALSLLFAVLAAVLTAVAVWAAVGAGGHARRWIVALAAIAIAGWLGSVSWSAFRRTH